MVVVVVVVFNVVSIVVGFRRDDVLVTSRGLIDDGDGGVTPPDGHAGGQEGPSVRPRVVIFHGYEIR